MNVLHQVRLAEAAESHLTSAVQSRHQRTSMSNIHISMDMGMPTVLLTLMLMLVPLFLNMYVHEHAFLTWPGMSLPVSRMGMGCFFFCGEIQTITTL